MELSKNEQENLFMPKLDSIRDKESVSMKRLESLFDEHPIYCPQNIVI